MVRLAVLLLLATTTGIWVLALHLLLAPSIRPGCETEIYPQRLDGQPAAVITEWQA